MSSSASETEGRRLLNERMQLRSLSQSALGRTPGISQNSVCSWCCGRSRPEPHLRLALQLLLGIPIDAWDTADETALIQRIAALVHAAP